jgi:hypothetical protein
MELGEDACIRVLRNRRATRGCDEQGVNSEEGTEETIKFEKSAAGIPDYEKKPA